jgi:hypothetical protein
VTAPPTPDVSRVADPQGYVDRAERTDGAFLAGVSAAPLLSMPLVYLLRRDDKRGRAELAPKAARQSERWVRRNRWKLLNNCKQPHRISSPNKNNYV